MGRPLSVWAVVYHEARMTWHRGAVGPALTSARLMHHCRGIQGNWWRQLIYLQF